ncbi:MAG TPA: hypothetical protein VFM71_12995 [Gemmatimonadaceae bacterium]|nr:hypothetical protein [Gemmatimonadaceae bacterium]
MSQTANIRAWDTSRRGIAKPRTPRTPRTPIPYEIFFAFSYEYPTKTTRRRKSATAPDGYLFNARGDLVSKKKIAKRARRAQERAQ